MASKQGDYWLVHQAEKKAFELPPSDDNSQELTIGSHRDSTLWLQSSIIKPKHCSIKSGMLKVHKAAKILINKTKTTMRTLKRYDVITIGREELQILCKTDFNMRAIECITWRPQAPARGSVENPINLSSASASHLKSRNSSTRPIAERNLNSRNFGGRLSLSRNKNIRPYLGMSSRELHAEAIRLRTFAKVCSMSEARECKARLEELISSCSR